MTMKTRASHTIPKPDLNKSLFDNYLTNSQVPTGYNKHNILKLKNYEKNSGFFSTDKLQLFYYFFYLNYNIKKIKIKSF